MLAVLLVLDLGSALLPLPTLSELHEELLKMGPLAGRVEWVVGVALMLELEYDEGGGRAVSGAPAGPRAAVLPGTWVPGSDGALGASGSRQPVGGTRGASREDGEARRARGRSGIGHCPRGCRPGSGRVCVKQSREKRYCGERPRSSVAFCGET